MDNEETLYKLSLAGETITVKEKNISQQLAYKIISLLMESPLGTDGDRTVPTPTTQPANGSLSTPPNSKAFMASKKPVSEIERITCLAYYLTHYKNTAAFKTRDLTKLNLEAAQPDFSNATVFVSNADAAMYLAKAGHGTKQITALGEAIVDALPDRERVKIAIAENKHKPRRRSKKSSTIPVEPIAK